MALALLAALVILWATASILAQSVAMVKQAVESK
jgi:hypothetical protein